MNDVNNCPDCRGTGIVVLLTSRAPCGRCAHAKAAADAAAKVPTLTPMEQLPEPPPWTPGPQWAALHRTVAEKYGCGCEWCSRWPPSKAPEVDVKVTLGPPTFESPIEAAVHGVLLHAVQEGHLTPGWMRVEATTALLAIPGVDGVTYQQADHRVEIDAFVAGEIKTIVCEVSF